MNYICHSGGAQGSDMEWENMGKNYGVQTVAYSFQGHNHNSKNAKILNEDELYEGQSMANIADKTLGRNFKNIQSPYVKNLIGRNWFQVKNAEEIFAVGTFINKRPNTIIDKSVVHALSGIKVEFIKAGGLGGITDFIDRHKESIINNERIKLKTSTLIEILDKYNAPAYIEYLNLDTEGSEFEILRTFDFNKYRFGCITVEHNYEEPKRKNINELLSKNGYVLYKSADFDDWYIDKNIN